MFPPTPPPPPFSSDQHQPRILYFIARSNATMVPLIPADELPFSVRLQNVPRVLNPDQIYGLQHVGSAPFTGLVFKLDHDMSMQRTISNPGSIHTRASSAASETPRFLAPDALARQALAHQSSSVPPKMQLALPSRPTSAHEPATLWRGPPNGADSTQDIINAIINTPAGAEVAARVGYHSKPTTISAPSGRTPDPEKKEFCTYWIRHGECDYAQQGCLYKHEMPDSLEGLQKLGLRRWPMWWQERNQQIKLGGTPGAVMTAGPKMRPAEWLKKGVDMEDSDADASDSEREQHKSVGPGVKRVPKMMPAAKEVQAASASKSTTGRLEGSKTAGERPEESETNDLISFDPETPETTVSPVFPTSGSPPIPTDTPATSITSGSDHESLTNKPRADTSMRKIFVPAGESADAHIDQYKKRTKARRESNTAHLEKQIQKLQKAGSNTGLMASKHAPPMDSNEAVNAIPDRRAHRMIENAGKRNKRPSTDVTASAQPNGGTTNGIADGRKSSGRPVLRPRVPKGYKQMPLPTASRGASSK